MSPHWNLQAGLAQRCSLRGPGCGPPHPRRRSPHLQAGRGRAGQGVPHHSRVISSSNQPNKGVCGGLELREPEKGGQGDAGTLLEGPSEGEGRWQHEPAPSETDSPQPRVLLCSRHTLSCNFAQSTGSPPGAKNSPGN